MSRKPEDFMSNGTGLWIRRGAPIAAIAVFVGTTLYHVGMQAQRLNYIEKEVGKALIVIDQLQAEIRRREDYTNSIFRETQVMKAQLIRAGVITP